jgi:hypothetical protein
MAMDIIAKEKKSITWRGLPANAERNVQDLRVDKVPGAPKLPTGAVVCRRLSA